MEDTANIGNEEITEEINEENIEGESKADKFRRLASKRTNNVLKQISGIGKLSTSAYEYTPEQVDKIFSTLQDALDSARNKFEKTKKTENTFQL